MVFYESVNVIVPERNGMVAAAVLERYRMVLYESVNVIVPEPFPRMRISRNRILLLYLMRSIRNGQGKEAK